MRYRYENGVKIYPDGREVCNLSSKDGIWEYSYRITKMFDRQHFRCCDCRELVIEWDDLTFEHENGRGAGKQDDRIEKDGKPINGAAHLACNNERGSKRTPIWHGETA